MAASEGEERLRHPALPLDRKEESPRSAPGSRSPWSAALSGTREWVATPDGLRISVREWGNAEGPEIVLIHGLAQCHLSFVRQIGSELARDHRLIAYDLRGHGESAKPADPGCYQDGRRWADELAAVIEAKRLRRPVLVGWSLGGRVVRQYLMHYGDRRLSGIHIVAARPIEDPAVLGPGSRADLSRRPADLAERIDAGIAFLRACFSKPPSDDEFAFMLAYNMIVPSEVREAIAGWATDAGATLAALRSVAVPTLIAHGRADRLILPAAAEMTAAAIEHARISWYEDCGHSPFHEDAARFNRELSEFVAACCRSALSEAGPHGHPS